MTVAGDYPSTPGGWTTLLRRPQQWVLSIDRLPDWVLMAVLVSLGTAVRLAVFDPATLHADEALFASRGLHIAETGDIFLINVSWSLEEPLPFFWALGACVKLFGNTPLAMRMLDLGAAAVTIGAVYILAREYGGRLAGWFSALCFAISPFAILFGASVFTDPPAVALGFAGFAFAARRHPGVAGVLVGAAVSAKLLAVAYAPVGLGLCLLAAPREWRRALARYVVGWAIAVGFLVVVMVFRTVALGAPWFLALQYQRIGGTGILPVSEWPARAQAWWGTASYFVVGTSLRIIAIVGIAGSALTALRRPRARALALLLLAIFSVGYVGLLVVTRLPTYDRYVLFVLPALCVLVGIGLAALCRLIPARLPMLSAALALSGFMLLRSSEVVAQAGAGTFPVGAQSDTTLSGYVELCDWLRFPERQPSVVWNRSLSWTFLYCLDSSAASAYWYPDSASIEPQAGAQTYLALSRRDDPFTVVSELRARGINVVEAAIFFWKGQENLWLYRLTT